jgi:hypothetical protein
MKTFLNFLSLILWCGVLIGEEEALYMDLEERNPANTLLQ